mmetsp:Transcript_33334/g.72790  ORF Transcript_33334/g.72790 Transcript_33334/m.72790 type:complete len:650 (-) Transcript_33334:260-2209(-)
MEDERPVLPLSPDSRRGSFIAEGATQRSQSSPCMRYAHSDLEIEPLPQSEKDLLVSQVPSTSSSNRILRSIWSKGWLGGRGGSGEEVTCMADIPRGLVMEAQRQAIPVVRGNLHHLRSKYNDARDGLQDKRQQFVRKAVDFFEMGDQEMDKVPSMSLDSPRKRPQGKEARKRWWTDACTAVHKPHREEDDPPAPPARPPPSQDAEDPEKEVPARGCLEVEVLAFSSEPELTRADGGKATAPLCQLAFGGRVTGALRCQGSTTARARFVVNEIVGSDLCVHVFDSDSQKFNFGWEDQAFCGGAIVPLVVLHHRCGRQEGWHAFENVREAELAVALLPIEAFRDTLKLQDGKLRDPQMNLGHVLLKLRLTLFVGPPGWLYVSMPFLGENSEVMVPSVLDVGDPVTVVKAVYTAIHRVKNALDFSLWFEAFDQLREATSSFLALMSIWSYYALVAPPWGFPVCIVLVLALLAFQMSRISRLARLSTPMRLYQEAKEDTDREMTVMERMKKRGQKAVKMERSLMNFAVSATKFASGLERVRYIFMLRDPHLSLAIGSVAVMGSLMATMALWVFVTVFGRTAMPLLFWALGCVGLLPRRRRQDLIWFVAKMKALKERILGPGRLVKVLACLWRRIPDSVEAQHFDLFEGYLLIP